MKKITSKCFSFKLEVLLSSESKIGYKDGRIGGLSCDVYVDVDVDFEQFDDKLLQSTGSDILSSLDQYIVTRISIDIEFRSNDLIDSSLLLEKEYDDCIVYLLSDMKITT